MGNNKKKSRKKKIIITLIVIAVILLIVIFNINKNIKQSQEPKISTETIEKRTIVKSISATGTIKSSSTKEFTSLLAGSEVQNVNVKVGDVVQAGDTLLTFNTDSLNDSLKLAQDGLNITKEQTNLSINAAERGLNTANDTRNSQYNTLDSNIKEIEKSINELDKQIVTVQNSIQPLQVAVNMAKTNLDSVTATNKPIVDSFNAKNNEYNNALKEYDNAKLNYSNAETDYNKYFSVGGANQLDSVGAVIPQSEYKDGEYASSEHRNADLAFSSGKTKLDEAEKLVGKTKIELDSMQSNYNTANQLINDAENKYNEATSTLQTANQSLAELSNAKTQLDSQYNQAKSTAESTKKSLDSSVDSARTSLDSSRLTAQSSLLTQENQIKTVQEQIEKGTIKSDVSGTVTSVNVEKGDTYQGGTLVKIEGCEAFIIEAQIDEYDIADVKEGMKVKIKTDATRNEELDGRVTFVSPAATEASSSMMAMSAGASAGAGSATYKIEISVDSANDRLRIGMNARLSIITEEAENTLTVPYDAIEEKEDGKNIIKVLQADDTEKEIEVTKGLESDYYTEIKSSEIKEGMKVIVPDTGNGDALTTLINTMQASTGI